MCGRRARAAGTSRAPASGRRGGIKHGEQGGGCAVSLVSRRLAPASRAADGWPHDGPTTSCSCGSQAGSPRVSGFGTDDQ